MMRTSSLDSASARNSLNPDYTANAGAGIFRLAVIFLMRIRDFWTSPNPDAMLKHMSERQTCFKSQTCDLAKMRGNEVHNTRAWTTGHSAPAYILDEKDWDPRGNISIVNRKLTPAKVLEQAAAHKIHKNSRLLREAIVVTKESTGKRDLARLWKALEQDWEIRVMYMHLHRDEGHVKPKSAKAKQESLEVEVSPTKLNWHVHVGYTQLRADGTKAAVDRDAMEQAQDICSRALNMPRGERGSARKGLSHKEWRKVAPVIDALKQEAELEKVRADNLVADNTVLQDDLVRLKEDNKRIRNLLKESGQAKQSDYQELKRIKDSVLAVDEKLSAMSDLAEAVIGRGAAAERRATEAEARAAAAEEEIDAAINTNLPGLYAIPAPAPPRQAAAIKDEPRESRWGENEKPRMEPVPGGPKTLLLPAVWYVHLRERLQALFNWRERLRRRFPHLVRSATEIKVRQAQDNVRRLNEAAHASIEARDAAENIHKVSADAENVPNTESDLENVHQDDATAETPHFETDAANYPSIPEDDDEDGPTGLGGGPAP